MSRLLLALGAATDPNLLRPPIRARPYCRDAWARRVDGLDIKDCGCLVPSLTWLKVSYSLSAACAEYVEAD